MVLGSLHRFMHQVSTAGLAWLSLVLREFCTAVDQVGRSVALIESSSIRRGEPPAEAVFWEGYRATLTKTTIPVVRFMQEISVRAASS